MLLVALKDNGQLRYVTAFLECWNVSFVLGPIDGGQFFLGVELDGMHKQVYESLEQLLKPFQPIDVSPFLSKMAI